MVLSSASVMHRRQHWGNFGGMLGAICLALMTGCSEPKPTAPQENGRPIGPIEIKLLVVDDPAMSAAIDQLRAEWKARTEATVILSQATSEELNRALSGPNSLLAGVDAVIYPSGAIGPMAAANLLAPLPADYAKQGELAWADTFELLQVADTRWAKTPLAIPFGSPVFTCYYRADLLAALHKRPPQTWTEYQELAALLAKRENLGSLAPAADVAWHGTVEPLAKGWAGRVLLARAAAYAKHRDHYSALFHIERMEPLIAGPSFVRALEELVAAAKLAPENVLELDPHDARELFLAGRSALALSWPSHASAGAEEAKPPATGFSELPGSAQVYNFAQENWETRKSDEPQRVTLLGVAGRLGSVLQNAAQPQNAFQLLAWLSGREWGPKVSGVSPATTLYRRSQMRAPQPWLDPLTDAEAGQQYATTVRDALSRPAYLFAVRIPGESEYLAALDRAVQQAVRGEQTPSDALSAAAATWKQITERLGLSAQRQAYRQSLGLEPQAD